MPAMATAVDSRFIPAGAGNTFWMPGLLISGPVYPRWRGEHTAPDMATATAGGLSP
ncbi:hypothetical protein IR284_004343, partial [Salmonella enterica]|nr:hypothetical protein [Salmonella enterica]